MGTNPGVLFKGWLFLCSFLILFSAVWAESKLSYPQRQAVERQSANMREVEKKIKAGFAPQEVAGLNQKLDNILADLTKNNCPDDNSQVIALKDFVTNARKILGEVATAETKKEESKTSEDKKEGVEKKDDKAETLPVKKTPETVEPEKNINEAKLTYQHKQAVDRQTSNLNELEAKLKELADKEPEIKYYPVKVEPGLGFLGKIEAITRDLEKSGCPKDHKVVAAIFTRLEDAKAKISDLEKKLQPKWELYDKFTNIANYPTYQADLDQLKRLHDKYNNSTDSFSNSKRGKELVLSYPDDASYFNTLPKKYAPLINFKRPEGEVILTRMKNISEKMKMFHEAKTAYGEKLPADIETGIHKAIAMAKQAVADKRPMFFTGGVKQLMDGALEDVEMLETIKGKEDAGAVKSREFYTKTQVELDAMAKTMEEEIIAGTQAPVEVYGGSDKNTLKKMMESKWKAKYPNDEILAIIFSVENWKRDTTWSYNNSNEWKKYDKSYLPVRVVVKTSDSIASVYVAYINKDHMSNDEIKIGLETKTGGYVVEKMLIKNLNK